MTTIVPTHIAIIMDGNGRWANKRLLPRIRGHLRGVSSIRKIVRECSNLGIRFLTLYSFSTENWRRPREEVNFLISLLRTYIIKEREELHRNGVKVSTIGDVATLPSETLRILQDIVEYTKNNTGLQLIIAFSYSGREDIVKATKRIASRCIAGELSPDEIDASLFAKFLQTYPVPDPDLLIRTSGEMRISNFMLWQIAYTEIYVTETFWPDFEEAELHKAVEVFRKRDRRFGGLPTNPR